MPRLPQTIDFDELAYPELGDIFRGIDVAIAAIVSSDPAFRPRPAHKRRSRPAKPGSAGTRKGRVERKAA